MESEFVFAVSEEDDKVAYLRFAADGAGRGKIAKTVSLRDLVGDYKGPVVYCDFTEDNELVGMEFLL